VRRARPAARPPVALGCFAEQLSSGAFGCACVDGQCNGGFCDGTGCSAQETANCALFGTQCVDHQCNGGFGPGNGCTAREELNCQAFGKWAIATHKLAEIEDKVSYPLVVVADDHRLSGLTITRDGQPLEVETWNRGVPIDGGEYAIAASTRSRRARRPMRRGRRR
jgi:hypothetical protein